MALTEADRAKYTQWLADAEAAYQKLVTGQAVRVFVDQNGERIEYAVGSLNRLQGYIASLQSKLGIKPMGPMSVWF